MRLHVFSTLAAILLLFVIGCGGGGQNENGVITDSQVPEEYLSALRTAVESRNVDVIRNQISNNYFEDCQTKEQFVAEVMSVLGTSGTIEFTTDPIHNKRVNINRGTAEFDGGFRIRVVDGETTREMSETGRFYLRRDNGPWQLYGDRSCN